jgi:hypothetical protein
MTGVTYDGEYLMDDADVAALKQRLATQGLVGFRTSEHGRLGVLVVQHGHILATVWVPWGWPEEVTA